jgi:hypothetical protein
MEEDPPQSICGDVKKTTEKIPWNCGGYKASFAILRKNKYEQLKVLRGATYKMEAWIRHKVFGMPLVITPAKAFCSKGDKWYLVVPRMVASWPNPLEARISDVLMISDLFCCCFFTMAIFYENGSSKF